MVVHAQDHRPQRPHYLVVNADESEPGTCKDREIMRNDPHTLVEGALIASFAMGARPPTSIVRGEYILERERLQAAVDEAYEAKLIGKDNIHGWPFDIYVHHGAGAYICGEETRDARNARRQEGHAADEAAVSGQYGPLRLPDDRQQCRVDRRRADDPAPRRRVVFELRRAQQCRHEVVLHLRPRQQAVQCRRGDVDPVPRTDRAHCGGVRGGCDNLLAVIPGGSSVRLVPAAQIIDTPLDFDSLAKLRSGLGTAAVIVMDKSTDIVRAITRLSYFYKHESCGQCTPCREGTGWMWRVMTRMAEGRAQKREIDMLLDVTKQVEGHTICALGDAAAWPMQGLIAHFRPEIERRIDQYAANPHSDAVRVAAE